jgi:hypothetical protein
MGEPIPHVSGYHTLLKNVKKKMIFFNPPAEIQETLSPHEDVVVLHHQNQVPLQTFHCDPPMAWQ